MFKHKVILFTGGYRFGRHPLEHLGPAALWPVGRRSAIEHVIAGLARQGVEEVVVYSDCQSPLAEVKPSSPWPLAVRFVVDPEVAGSGGMLRLAMEGQCEGKIVVLPANAVNLPPVQWLVEAHAQGGGELTVFLNPGLQSGLSEIYVCEPDILEHVPEQGYWDVKERVIPELAVLGKKVHQVVLDQGTGCFHDRSSYLKAVSDHLEQIAKADDRLSLLAGDADRQVWASADVRVHPTARLCGPVILLEGATVGQQAVVVGPVVVGRRSFLASASVVVESVLWEDARVGEAAELQRCVMGSGSTVPSHSQSQDRVVVSQGPVRRTPDAAESGGTLPMADTEVTGSSRIWAVAGLAAVAAAYLWSFWPDLQDLWGVWQVSEEYSSGLLVPFLAAYVVWCRRDEFRSLVVKPCLWGLVLLVLVQALRLFGLYSFYNSVTRLSVVLTIAGLVLWLGGRDLLRRSWTVLAFLLLMLPWPNRVQQKIGIPLQGWSTASAVFGLELTGYDVVREGNIIRIGDTSVAVAEACNGLRMITAFVVISGLVAMLVQRPGWQKLVILISSLPIALICNTLRLAATSVAYTLIKGDQMRDLFHRFGGYAMMPLALAVVVGELWLLSRLTTKPIMEQGVAVIRRRER
jgi:exosortase